MYAKTTTAVAIFAIAGSVSATVFVSAAVRFIVLVNLHLNLRAHSLPPPLLLPLGKQVLPRPSAGKRALLPLLPLLQPSVMPPLPSTPGTEINRFVISFLFVSSSCFVPSFFFLIVGLFLSMAGYFYSVT